MQQHECADQHQKESTRPAGPKVPLLVAFQF